MSTFIRNHNQFIYIFLLIVIGGFFHFYNLNWGNPFYFHPDERNIASSVVQLNFPNQMNPHFFAYGSFPLYGIYFTSVLMSLLHKSQNQFMQAIAISRFYSASLATLLIPSIFFLGTKLVNKRVGFLAAIFCTLSVGFIQFAHFGTFEIWLTFLGVWLFYFSLILLGELNFKNTFFAGIIFGLLMATKISSFPVLLLPLISIVLNLWPKRKKGHLKLSKIVFTILILIIVSAIIFTAFSPYVFLDFSSFYSSIQYESSVAFGTLPVFYTGEFFSTIPVLFQFLRIYPFLVNPILTVIFIPSFFYLTFIGTKTKNLKYLILNTCYVILFLPQAFVFAKWTRYMVPTLPFIYLIIAIALEKLINEKKLKYLLLAPLIIIAFIFSISFFITASIKPDTRIEASLWARDNIPSSGKTISEVYDMGIVPFNQYLQNIYLFNFYDLDQIPDIKNSQLSNLLSESTYIILPSQRILKTRILNANKFPFGNNFYGSLLNIKLGYEKIYETPCDIFCRIIYMGDPVFSFEETVNVFDRPTVFIFKKSK